MRIAGGRSVGRGQAIQLGALLLFAILIINLSLFQVFVIPDQNGEIEFKHSQQVQSELLDVRNAVLDAATGDQSFVEIDLAPAYPSRTLFVNPGEPAGTVRTTEDQSISIINDSVADPETISSDACPGASVPATRALEYRAGYNYYDNAPTYRVENTVLFREFPGETLPGSGQQLVTGNSINLLPLRNDFSESGTGSATVEPIPGGVLTTRVVDPEIELPTAYSEPVWEETLSGAVAPGEISVSGGTLTLSLSGTYALNCGPIGLNGPPPSGARAGGLPGSGGGGDGAGSINPAGFSDVQLVSVSDVAGSNSDVQVKLKNTDNEAKSLVRGRIPFYYAATGGGTTRPDYADLNGDTADRLGIRDRSETIDQDIEIGAGGTKTLTFEFNENIKDDFFVFDAVYSDGTRATYYIDAGGGGSGSGSGSGFSSVSADDVPQDTTTTQTFSFSPDSQIGNMETITINLDSAQALTDGDPDPVDYTGASVSSPSDGTTLMASSDSASITYEVSGNLKASDTVTIEISGVDTQSDSTSNPISVSFTRSDTSESTSDSFSVT